MAPSLARTVLKVAAATAVPAATAGSSEPCAERGSEHGREIGKRGAANLSSHNFRFWL